MASTTGHYFLAADHSYGLLDLFGEDGAHYGERRLDWRELKTLMYEGLLSGLEQLGRPASHGGVLIDVEYGEHLLHRAQQDGIPVGVRADRPGVTLFELMHGENFPERLDRMAPDYVQIVVNPEVGHLRAEQMDRVRRLCDWLADRPFDLMLEFPMPASEAALASVGGSRERFLDEVRPINILRAICDFQAVGVEPQVWKVDGIADPAMARKVAEQARSAGRNDVEVIVRGGGTDEERLLLWLRTAGHVDGYNGFAIGRSAWAHPLTSWLSGENDADATIRQIGERYASYVEAFEGLAEQTD